MSASSANSHQALSLFSILCEQATRFPEQAAIAAPGRSPMTYQRLVQRLGRMQEALHCLGIGRTDRVALALPPGPELAVALLGVASTATCVPLNPADAALDIEAQLSHLDVKALIMPFGEKGNHAYTAVQGHGMPVLELTTVPETEAGFFALTGHTRLPLAAPELPHDDDVAFILPSTGSSAQARPVYLTHANLSLSAWQVAARLKLDASDCCLSIVPPFQSHGLVAGLLASLIVGANVACPPDFQGDAFFQWLDACRPSWYTANPSMHQDIIGCAPQYDAPIQRCPLRFIRSASASLQPRVMRALERIFRAPVIDAYGATEMMGQLGDPYERNSTLSTPRREAWATASAAAASA